MSTVGGCGGAHLRVPPLPARLIVDVAAGLCPKGERRGSAAPRRGRRRLQRPQRRTELETRFVLCRVTMDRDASAPMARSAHSRTASTNAHPYRLQFPYGGCADRLNSPHPSFRNGPTAVGVPTGNRSFLDARLPARSRRGVTASPRSNGKRRDSYPLLALFARTATTRSAACVRSERPGAGVVGRRGPRPPPPRRPRPPNMPGRCPGRGPTAPAMPSRLLKAGMALSLSAGGVSRHRVLLAAVPLVAATIRRGASTRSHWPSRAAPQLNLNAFLSWSTRQGPPGRPRSPKCRSH